MGETFIAIAGLVIQNKAAEEAVVAQQTALTRRQELESAEIRRQAEFQQAQLEEDLKIQRINADLQEVDRQISLRKTLSSQRALAAGRFDVSTSRSFLALTESTSRMAEGDIQAIRLGADITRSRNFLEQQEISAGAKSGVIASQTSKTSTISVLRATAKAERIGRVISTVGKVVDSIKPSPTKGR